MDTWLGINDKCQEDWNELDKELLMRRDLVKDNEFNFTRINNQKYTN